MKSRTPITNYSLDDPARHITRTAKSKLPISGDAWARLSPAEKFTVARRLEGERRAAKMPAPGRR